MPDKPFDPSVNPGGYVEMAYQYAPLARRTVAPLINGGASGNHLGFMQKKELLIFWHSLELNLEEKIAAQEIGGYRRVGEAQINPVIDPTVNLFNTRIEFVRYAATEAELQDKPANESGY